ncbi:hypothetical protein BHE90_016713 [Fusarium euwallaceae]|uniref:Uncharacterized protein n=1 Tax=Fusarium euwallaceae TaxID=1147111 RepID=A0A430KZL7_9HYPO|nr:hypothetical protein BHE90_016713 [Fusarium euwallaceae]
MDKYSTKEWQQLCHLVKQLVPQELGQESWYLIIAATLVTSPDPELLASFYAHVTTHNPDFASEEAKRRLSERFRDVLLKLTTLVGAPRVLCAVMPLAKAEGDVQAKAKCAKLKDKWHTDQLNMAAIYDRGVRRMDQIYGSSLLPKVFDSYGTHKEDLKFNEFFAVYGLYLSDLEVMTSLETEAVVFTSISCLGLKSPGAWHFRGMGRLLLASRGKDEPRDITTQLGNLKDAVIGVVKFVGGEFVHTSKCEQWATVEDIENQLGGWGLDD